jgi:hypothetical protein
MNAQKIFIPFWALLAFDTDGTFQIEGNANLLSSSDFATVTEWTDRGNLDVISFEGI